MTKPTSHKKIYIIGGIAAAVMFMFCFAMVPLYSLICKSTGINTSVLNSDLVKQVAAGDSAPDLSREVTLQLIAVNNMGLPWDFYPEKKTLKVHPGENMTVYFQAKNTTDKEMVVQAIPSMTPPEALGHFHKIECFCFRQQKLAGHASKRMPLIFNIDKSLPKDTHVITLAYTLFEVTPNELKKKGKKHD